MNRLLYSVAIITIFFFTYEPALAADPANGKKVFRESCAICHKDGNNFVNPAKTLKKNALQKNNLFSLEAIVNQVTDGKGQMPAFKDKLDKESIEDVAQYVLDQAEKGW